MNSPSTARAALRRLPGGVWALGAVSFLMDLSSETIHSLLPVFLVSTLGASAATLGVIEGIAEATASITKIFSGVWSDRIGRRKPLAVLGYGLAAITKPLFPLAGSAAWVLAARFLDRVGKGIRGAPRDALVADLTPPPLRGAAYGLRQSLDTAGALGGPLLAIGLMTLLANDIRGVFWWAVLPAFAAVAVLAAFVREPEETRPPPRDGGVLRWAVLGELGAPFWRVTLAGTALMLARFSEAFLVLRLVNVGASAAAAPWAMVAMNLTYVLSAYPFGHLSDRIGRLRLLAAGIGVLVASDLVLAAATGVPAVLAGAALWGLHMGLTQGLLGALVADAAPAPLRGSAFGVFNLLGGVALLIASAVAGWLWQSHGASATFLFGAGLALASLVGLVLVRVRPAG